MINDLPVPRLEPPLDEVMSDPIIQLVMRRDGLSDVEVWKVIRSARGQLAVRSDHRQLRQPTDGTSDSVDCHAKENAEFVA